MVLVKTELRAPSEQAQTDCYNHDPGGKRKRQQEKGQKGRRVVPLINASETTRGEPVGRLGKLG